MAKHNKVPLIEKRSKYVGEKLDEQAHAVSFSKEVKKFVESKQNGSKGKEN